MKYNTQREKLIIPEYGRHIQQLVDHCITIQDDEERNRFAKSVIDVMGVLNPHLRDVPDFQHKLWDQLFIMSDFKLKVKSPYPILNKSEIFVPPYKMPYPKKENKYRYYGSNVKKMIEVAKSWEDGDKKEGLKIAIANQMKKNYLKWNKEQVEDQVIFNHLDELSNGSLQFKEGDTLMHVVIQTTPNKITKSIVKNQRKKANNFINKNKKN